VVGALKLVFADPCGFGQDGGVVKIEIPEG